MEINKTSTSPGGRITVIDALRGFSLIGICLIHAMQILHYVLLPVRFKFLYPDGPGGKERT